MMAPEKPTETGANLDNCQRSSIVRLTSVKGTSALSHFISDFSEVKWGSEAEGA